MRLLVDDRWFHDGGIGKFSLNLINRCPLGIELDLVGKSWRLADPLSPIKLWNEIRRRQPDAFWTPGFMPPIATKTPSVISIHDLTHLDFGTEKKVFYYNNIIRPLAKRCNRIITVSNFSKRLIADWLNMSEDIISVVPNGVSKAFFTPASKFRLEKPYFLYVGNRRKNKNIRRMLHAFSISGLSKDFLFLLSGNKDTELSATINSYGLEKSVVFGGYFSEESLPSVYSGAVASVFVSLDEGFGLPNIEAFAAGTVAITSNLSAIPEIAGEGAFLVDAFSEEHISEAMKQVAYDPELREKLIKKGSLVAQKYSWDTSAEIFWNVISNTTRERPIG